MEDTFVHALSRERIPAVEGTYALELSDSGVTGVGRSWRSDFVFVGPGQALEAAFSGPHCEFRPWAQLDSVGNDINFEDAAVLLLRPPFDEVEVFDAVAAVFRGLTSVAEHKPEALGATVRSLRLFLESGLRPQLSRDGEVGLLGELIVIASAAEPQRMVESWHRRATATHDFSAPGERLEVKSTTGIERSHHFSEGQVRPTPGVCTTFASVLMPEIEGGATVADMVDEIDALLEPEESVDFLTKVISVTGCPPVTVCSVAVDRGAAVESLWHLGQAAIPRPIASPGVSEMKWRALISEPASPPPECGFIAQIVPRA